MRILGALMFVIGGAGTAAAMRASFSPHRGAAALFGLLAPVMLLVALLGALLVFVPDFLS
jgi:hypothetical protein